jgi:hypothetical protein
MVDSRTRPGSAFWLFHTSVPDGEYILTVTDTHTGATRVYTDPQGTPFQPIQDANAFATCP